MNQYEIKIESIKGYLSALKQLLTVETIAVLIITVGFQFFSNTPENIRFHLTYTLIIIAIISIGASVTYCFWGMYELADAIQYVMENSKLADKKIKQGKNSGTISLILLVLALLSPFLSMLIVLFTPQI